MTTRNDIEAYFDACRTAFRTCPEWHRIDLYAAHASRDGENPVHLYRLAKACFDGGSVPLWRQGVDLALALPHDSARSIDDRREALRRLGDWSAWQDVAWPTNPDELPSGVDRWWDGVEDLSGKTLLVCDLGAHGDTIRWLRFAEALSGKVSARIFWEVSANLLELAEHNVAHLPHMHAWDRDRTDGHFDRALNANLLPRLIGSLPPFVRRSAPMPLRLPERSDQARLGLAWGTQHVNYHLERSVPIGMLMPFFWRPDVEFYSLQVGVRAQEAWIYPRVKLPEPPLESFADTANVIAALDGVITVDTSVAHLAGSLGVPTLTLLPFYGDIVWGFGETTSWYPTMRFIRQRAPWDWLSVQSQLHEALDSRWWEEIASTSANLMSFEQDRPRSPNRPGLVV